LVLYLVFHSPPEKSQENEVAPPPLPIHLPGKFTFKQSRTIRAKLRAFS
jgi:hypothetical protein